MEGKVSGTAGAPRHGGGAAKLQPVSPGAASLASETPEFCQLRERDALARFREVGDL